MSRAAIYAVSTASQSIAAGGTVSFDTVVRKTGSAVSLNGSSVMTTEAGFYRVNANVTLAPVLASATTVSVLVNGTPVPGAQATFTPAEAAEVGSVSIPCMIRTYGCCMAAPSTITVQISAAASVTNAAIEVVH